MFSDKWKARLAGLALAGAALAVTPSAVSAGVVVKSSGPSASTYPVGRQIADSATITLRSGDRITVLTDSGTRVMSGPGTFRVGEGARRTRTRFSNLTRRGSATRARTGAVRGATGPSQRPNLWMVDVTAEGTQCMVGFDRVRLWRPEKEEAETYSIVDQASQDSLDVSFVAGETVRALDPAGLTVAPGGTYTITSPVSAETGEANRAVVTFVALEGEMETPAQIASALHANGCTTQLELLAETAESEAS